MINILIGIIGKLQRSVVSTLAARDSNHCICLIMRKTATFDPRSLKLPSKVVMISNGVIFLVLFPHRMASKTINTTDNCEI